MARLEYAAALRENAKLNFALIKSTKKVAAARQRRLYEYDRLKKGESNEKPLEEGVDYPGSPAVVWSTRWTALPKKKSQSTTRESLFGSCQLAFSPAEDLMPRTTRAPRTTLMSDSDDDSDSE